MEPPRSEDLSNFEGTLAALSPSLAARLNFNSSSSQASPSLLPASGNAGNQRELACASNEILIAGAGDQQALAVPRSMRQWKYHCSTGKPEMLRPSLLVQADSRPGTPSQHNSERSYSSTGSLHLHHAGRRQLCQMQSTES